MNKNSSGIIFINYQSRKVDVSLLPIDCDVKCVTFEDFWYRMLTEHVLQHLDQAILEQKLHQDVNISSFINGGDELALK
jgi:hypothetical protein